MSCMDPARKISQAVCSIVFLAMGAALVAAPAQGGGLPRSAPRIGPGWFKSLSAQTGQELRQRTANLGRTGVPSQEGRKDFSAKRVLDTVECVQARERPHRIASYRPPKPAARAEGQHAWPWSARSRAEGSTTKINTGWILDQHVFDPESPKNYPTLISDFKRNDEGGNDLAMGHSDHPSADSMFGWVWQVQSFYWSGAGAGGDHAAPSYCLFVMVSSDGGFTWQLYEILYDPTSLDLINPKLAIDITGSHDRFYIAYELVTDASNHDVYVYSETSQLDGGTVAPNPVNKGIATTTSMERNPAIASDYISGETSYRVVAYEYAYSDTDFDIYATQSTGDGSAWTTPVAVAETAAMETHPALSAGCTGDGGAVPFSAYMHLAYNYDSSTSTSEVRYARAAHPGTAYPSGLASAAKLAVLPNTGTPAWPYGPPAIAASHGGSPTLPGGRVLVAADQLFPMDQPSPGDPERYQITYAVNSCNGGATCGDVAGCSPALSLNWTAYYLDDLAADYRYPALVVDGMGWLEGSSSVPQNGVAIWPEVFMAYDYRRLDSASPLGSVHMLLTDASDESCTGFASGPWYSFTASEKASDDDDSVVARPGTLAAFNYFYGWPGVCFNKQLNHLGGTMNEDVYFTTLGDNYVIDTQASGIHIDAYYTTNGVRYVGPWTFPWPAGYQMTVTADATAADNGLDYAFSNWSTGDRSTDLTLLTSYCGPAGSCPDTAVNALYNATGGTPLRVPYSAAPTTVTTSNRGTDLAVTWDVVNCASAGYHLLYGKGEGLPAWTVDGGVCALGAKGSYDWLGVPDPATFTSRFLWFLVVGDNGLDKEGSWGLTYPDGAEEGGAAASNVCGMAVKDLSGTCGTP